MKNASKVIIGRLESIALPDLAIDELQVRVDTGAKTSSLHVDNIKKSIVDGVNSVTFDLHPDVHNVDTMQQCTAPISDMRKVKSSNGTTEQRYVIETPIVLGEENWSIEITLTDRSDMSYLMLLGREALGKRFLVDPSKVFLGSK
ncbi:ATP-dependent zinc protease family protein [Colwellia hornerae]|uniref:ATP-dependent zinc protease n=1 Tax=Colwellia hornerae TaxID=89402 RepID=A0A5C6Q3G4_9GAMM|nr:RimK/LysX family protein [Colwellia hornerae]TWX47865.1 ATP-dependent zinc protease [Colwellia hornerae]TWX54872.1 ATP-dependent zinc protease [Colwellia hornerae]TWX63465.1 ATP-dependent zinc protease [Colwellia hornerae]